MRKIVAYALSSLDGVAEAPETFLMDYWDDALDANLAEVISSQDAVILGRRSYDEWARFWPTSDLEPFATFINGVEKHVATSSPLGEQWTNASAVEGDLADFVCELKARDGGDVGVHASLSVVQSLLATGVLDELRLIVAPVVVGEGRKLLDGLPRIPFELVRSATSPSGALMLDYRVAAA